MPKSEQQRQKKLARKKTKERRAKKTLARKQQQLASLAGKMLAASSGEIVHCCIGTGLKEGTGMGTVWVSRRAPNGHIAVAIFLIDSYCLGVKDTAGLYRTPSDYAEIFERTTSHQEMEPARPEVARGLVEAAVDYAASLGFAPHIDYRKLQPIWGNIEAASVEGEFEFGSDGKPTYVNGPNDDPARQQLILKTLKQNVGEGNFHFTLGFPGGFDSELDFDDVEEIDEVEANELQVDGRVLQRIDSAED